MTSTTRTSVPTKIIWNNRFQIRFRYTKSNTKTTKTICIKFILGKTMWFRSQLFENGLIKLSNCLMTTCSIYYFAVEWTFTVRPTFIIITSCVFIWVSSGTIASVWFDFDSDILPIQLPFAVYKQFYWLPRNLIIIT